MLYWNESINGLVTPIKAEPLLNANSQEKVNLKVPMENTLISKNFKRSVPEAYKENSDGSDYAPSHDPDEDEASLRSSESNSSENYGELSKSIILTLDEGDQIDVSGCNDLTVNNMNGDSTVSLTHYIFWGFKVGGSTDNYKYKRTV